SVVEAPRPPNSRGQCTPTQPPPARRRCQSTRKRTSSASVAKSSSPQPAGMLAVSQPRSSQRKASSSAENVRSIGETPHTHYRPATSAQPPARARESQHPLGDDVALNLVGAAGDAGAARPQHALLPAAAELRVGAERLQRQGGELLGQVGPEELDDRA